MRFTSTLSIAAVIALASAGSAMAADGFGTLEGVQAKALSATELASVRGEDIHIALPAVQAADDHPVLPSAVADGVVAGAELSVPVIGGVGVENTPPLTP